MYSIYISKSITKKKCIFLTFCGSRLLNNVSPPDVDLFSPRNVRCAGAGENHFSFFTHEPPCVAAAIHYKHTRNLGGNPEQIQQTSGRLGPNGGAPPKRGSAISAPAPPPPARRSAV